MSQETRTRALWITAACLGVALVTLLAIAWRTPSAVADEAQAAQVADASCTGKLEPTAPAVEELMQQVIEQRERNGVVEGADFVVLNNRGYNYGPPPGVEFDSLLGDVAAESAGR